MDVSDLAVATLRALLADEIEQYKRLLRQISTDGDKRAYAILIAAAFFRAANKRSEEGATRSDMIEFVADVRSRSEQARDDIDPRTAERSIQAVVSDADISDLDARDVRRHQVLLLAGFIADERFSPAELDEFMAGARGLADGTVSP